VRKFERIVELIIDLFVLTVGGFAIGYIVYEFVEDGKIIWYVNRGTYSNNLLIAIVGIVLVGISTKRLLSWFKKS
jgi:hypothetical protein